MNFYTSEKINENLTLIRSVTGELLYLLEGEKKSALIDCGVGVGHVRDFVKALTKNPITVFLSHGHVDHAMGAPDFDKVYLNDKDIPLYQRQCSLQERRGYLQAILGEEANNIQEEDFTKSEPNLLFESLQDGMVFEIGSFHLECYELPGHTKGSMIFLIREMQILILGDACNNSTFLFDEDSLPLSAYKIALDSIRNQLKGRYN